MSAVEGGMHPFISWVAALKRLDAIRAEGKDVILGDGGARRFGIGSHEGRPLLCWAAEDAGALESVKWTSAAVVFGLNGRDWIALSATDVRVAGAQALAPVPMRLFVPVAMGRLSAWKETPPERLAVGRMETGKGAPVFRSAPFKELPVKLLGKDVFRT